MDDLMDAPEFFKGLYRGVGAGYIEIRPLLDKSDPRYGTPSGHQVEAAARKSFLWPRELQACGRHCADLNGRFHVYFGVGLRKDSKGGAKSDVGCLTSIFADIDFKDVPRDQAHSLMQQFPVLPSACVRSGHGVHVYWFLKEPVYQNGIDRLERINLGILMHFGAQRGPQNADRILRVPGTRNIKAEYDPKPLCEVSWWRPEFRYSLDQFSFVEAPEPKRDLFAEPHPECSLIPTENAITACAKLLSEAWIPGSRHYMALAVAGWCAHARISHDSAFELVSRTCQFAQDEEIQNRLGTVRDTYRKYSAGDAVSGRQSFVDLLCSKVPAKTAARVVVITAILKAHLSTEREECSLLPENS